MAVAGKLILNRRVWAAVPWGLLTFTTMLVFAPDRFPVLAMRAWLCAMSGCWLVAGMGLVASKQYRAGGVLLVAALVAAGPPLQVWWSNQAEVQRRSVTDPGLCIAQLNVHEANDKFDEVVAAAMATGADLIVFHELDARWIGALKAGLSDRYPWNLHAMAETNYGIALFSRMPTRDATLFDLEGLPAIRAELGSGAQALRVVAVHLRAPESASKAEQRDRQWQALEEQLADSKVARCLVGDLNTVPWDQSFQRFSRASGLLGGSGVLQPTWPAWGSMAIIPLDHILASPGRMIRDRRTFRIPGSDHLGVVARVMRVPGG